MTSTAISAEATPPVLLGTDVVAIVIAGLLCVNVACRLRNRSPNRALLWANIAMIITLVLSISHIYEALDPLLGGASYLNLTTHLLMVWIGWAITRATEWSTSRLAAGCRRPVLLGSWVPLTAAAGTVISFLLLNPDSSRGLESYDQEPAYVAYWLFTMLPLLFAALPLLPRLAEALGKLKGVPPLVGVSLVMLMCSYMGIVLCAVFYALTAVLPEMFLLREIIVAMTLLAFTTAFTTASLAPQSASDRHHQPAHP